MTRDATSASHNAGQAEEEGSPHRAQAVVSAYEAKIERRMPILLESEAYVPAQLQDAMSHALLGGGKRIRPLLFMLMTAPEDGAEAAALDVACAIEMVHTASLILDDLPCMDDAALRRGQATTHVRFGQATAILAAIALLSRSLNIISEIHELPAETRIRLVAILSEAVGHAGLAAGQELDVSGTGAARKLEEIETVNWLKTGKLFVAAAEMANLLGDRTGDQRSALVDFARHLGTAFQTFDDCLDTGMLAGQIGKDTGKDFGKSTLVSVLNIDQAWQTCEEHLRRADRALCESGVPRAPIRLVVDRCLPLKAGARVAANEDA